MSLIDIYRKNIQRKREEISQLQRDKAREANQIASLTGKINSESQSISRTTNASTIKSKLQRVERLQKDIARAEKKNADIELKIANKHKELASEEQKLNREEKIEADKKLRQAKEAERQHQQQMSSITKTLTEHSQIHKHTLKKIDELSKLPKKINVLFLAANPLDQDQLRLDEEVREITEKIRGSKHRDSVNLVSCWAARPLDLLQAINEHTPSIIHFSGHGSSQEELVFQGNSGETKLVTKEAIVQTIMASSDVRLIFFNACYSRSQAEAVVNHVEAAIGMNDSIDDKAARIFAAAFYSAIGFGLTLEKAFNQAKAALMLENIPDENIPELFVNNNMLASDIIIVQPES